MLHALLTIIQHALQQNLWDVGKLALGAVGYGFTALLIKLRKKRTTPPPTHHNESGQRMEPIPLVIILPVRIDELDDEGHPDSHHG